MRRGLRRPGGRGDLPGKQKGEHLTVSALTRQIKSLLEDKIGRVAVEGEIGSLTKARSGHLYITLKDEKAVLDVVMWRSAASRVKALPVEGEKVVVRGEVTVYEPRGRYQMVASSIQPVGQGELQARYEALVAKLREEGLFDPGRKKLLPELPATVGVVTSATGAAVRDIIKVLRRRMPGIRIVLSPCRVQGEGATSDIVKALGALDRWGESDVIILGRGGGSLEDLWAFNEEPVARAVAACKTPVVSAVGHETDVSITDLVADVRAATPSEAAETVVLDMGDFARQVRRLWQGLSHALTSRIRMARVRARALAKSPALTRPMDMVHQRQQLLDDTLSELCRGIRDAVQNRQRDLALVSAGLEALSPLGVLSRGYSVTTTEAGKILQRASQVKPGHRILSRLADGTVISEVIDIRNGA